MYKAIKIDINTGLMLEDVLFDDGIIPIDEDIILDKPQEGLHHPKRDFINKVWVEGKVFDLEEVKKAKIAKVKAEAAEKINAIAPIWKQINIMREVGDIDPRFTEIDAVRFRSNELEAQVNSAVSLEEIEEINIVVW